MPANDDITQEFSQRIQSSSTTTELNTALDEILAEEASGNLESADALTLVRIALEAAAELSWEDPRAAQLLIEQFLLPNCVKEQVETGARYNFALSNLRKLLADWIERFPSPNRSELRKVVLNQLCKSIADAPTKEKIWTVGRIGYRDEQVLDVLWPIAERHDELGDAAVGTLAGLGLTGEQRTNLVRLIRDKTTTGIRSGLLYALQELAGPEVLEILLPYLSASDSKSKSTTDVPLSFLITILSKVSDRLVDDLAVQDRVWEAISRHRLAAISSSEIAGRCDTPKTVIDYVRWTIEPVASEARPESRYIHYQRLADLVRPRQLGGWEQVPRAEFLRVLQQDACRNTELSGEFVTTEVRLKVDAFETGLALGSDEPIGWLEDAVGRESNRYVQQMVLEAAASLRVEPLPRCVVELIIAEADVTARNTGEVFARTGAIRLAQSAGTRDAFELLLNCGFTYEGSVLRSTADAMVNVAVARFDAGDSDVAILLLDRAFHGPAERHRDVAIDALCGLAIRRELEPKFADDLLELFEDTNLKEYTRCKAIEAIGFIDLSETDHTDSYLAKLTDAGGEIGLRATEALIRRGQHHLLSERVFNERIGVRMLSDIWSLVSHEKLSGWQAFLIGLLYQADRDRFAHAIADALRYSSSDIAFKVYASAIYYGLGTPSIVVDGLVKRIFERSRRDSAETGLFDLLATMAPERLLIENWVEAWNEWLPDARVALCDAIGRIVFETPDVPGRAISTLSASAFDSAFAVRRAAFRALAAVDAGALESSCRQWARSEKVEVRQRAAEAAVWLPRDVVDDESVEQIGLAADREASVREIAKRIVTTRRNRYWASHYLDRVLSVQTGDSQDVLAAYRYGRALAKLGDDEAKRRLAQHLSNVELPANVVHWLNCLVKAIDERWKTVTRQWPDPWIASEGAIEEHDGQLVFENGVKFAAHFSLWCRWATGPSDLYEWGAVAYLGEEVPLSQLVNSEHVKIGLPGRSPALALIGKQLSSPRPSQQALVLHGSDEYPRAESDK